MSYPFKKIERKWQRMWRAKRVHEPDLKRAKHPFYNLMMFPYPSAEGLHVGNMYAFVGSDVYGRMKRMQGHDVFEPMGLDGFGIHSENYALKVGAHPMKLAVKTERNFYRQLQMIGNGFSWGEKVETWKPEYYRWTQWVFLQLFKRGLAYRKNAPVNWCTSCLTVLADEQVLLGGKQGEGVCERCGSTVVKRELEQWFLKITKYADRLLANLDRIDWSPRVTTAQRNWIGKSEGAVIPFTVQGQLSVYPVPVFTTRPDTLFGATYVVLAPTHAFINEAKAEITNFREVQEYRETVAREETRNADDNEKTGIPLEGVHAVHPVNGSQLPVWVSDYVLGSVGTGAVMGVPAHDARDFAFAKRYGLPIVHVVQSVKPRECLLIHDVGSAGNEHWFPWLGGKLEEKGWRVLAPTLPGGERPVAAEWEAALESYGERLNEESVVIGHGAGAYAALRFIQKTGKRVRKIILVAPTHPDIDWRRWRSQHAGEVDEATLKAFHKAGNIEWERVKKLAGSIVVYYSANDPFVPPESMAYYKARLGADNCRLVGDRFHFDEYHGVTDFPELIAEFDTVYTGEGILFNSGTFNGMTSEEARSAILASVGGKREVQYRLRDWLISRQRYWGPPIPLIYCDACKETVEVAKRAGETGKYTAGELENPGWVPVAEHDLPVRLPFVKEFRPTGTGVSPLAAAERFVRVRCPRCKAWARRETDVSDTFLDSAWYFFRYVSPRDAKRPFDRRLARKWLPVNMYIGGAEHSVLHLLYTRFLTMVFSGAGLVDFEEPFQKFRAHGLLIREGAKMSKSKGNVVNPDSYVERFGADALRMYLMFLAPFEEGGDFQDRGILGVERFLNRVHAFFTAPVARTGRKKAKADIAPRDAVGERLLHQTIAKITEDIEELRFNTAISALMILFRQFEEAPSGVLPRAREAFVKLLHPFVPHLAQELWEAMRKKTFLERERWPVADARLLEDAEVTLVVQVNGKFRDAVSAPRGLAEAAAQKLALAQPKVQRALGNSKIQSVVFVPDRLINLCTTSSG